MEIFTRDTLKRLRNEIRAWETSSPSIELRYASLITAGPRNELLASSQPAEIPLSKWEVLRERERMSPPIATGSFRRVGKHGWVDYCFNSNMSEVEWRRFEDWSAAATTAAVEALSGSLIDLEIIPMKVNGWMHVCYRVGWTYPERVDFEVKSGVHIDRPFPADWLVESREGSNLYRPRPRTYDPFSSWSAFDAYERGKVSLQVGRHFSWLSRDVRTCSASVIDALLYRNESRLEAVQPDQADSKPILDTVKRELLFESVVCKKCKKLKSYQFNVLRKFQEAGWETHIYPPEGIRDISQLIKDLNGTLEEGSPVTFGVDGNRIFWSRKAKKA